RQVAMASQNEMPQMATAGNILATTSPGDNWRPS
ncbi:hypothetical protein A2U01_0077674, partial [Trifolium medium]|nr:hypothetical protein [Trifolium medium]